MAVSTQTPTRQGATGAAVSTRQEPDAYDKIALLVGDLMNKNLKDVLEALSDPKNLQQAVKSAEYAGGALSGASVEEMGEVLKQFWGEFGGCRIALDFSSISGRASREHQQGYQIQPYQPPGVKLRLPGWPKEVGVGIRVKW